MVGIDRVAEPEAIGKETGAKQDWVVVECHERPGPGRHIGSNEHNVDGDDSGGQIAGPVVECPKVCAHGTSAAGGARTGLGCDVYPASKIISTKLLTKGMSPSARPAGPAIGMARTRERHRRPEPR